MMLKMIVEVWGSNQWKCASYVSYHNDDYKLKSLYIMLHHVIWIIMIVIIMIMMYNDNDIDDRDKNNDIGSMVMIMISLTKLTSTTTIENKAIRTTVIKISSPCQ